MAETKIYLTNLKEVQQDFKNQDRHFHKAIAKSMKVIGMQLKKTQKATLRAKVSANPTGRWTGNLSSSIVTRPKAKSVTVGAILSKATYANWIENAQRSINVGNFKGYWYMKSSLAINKGFIMKRLQKDMGSTAKLKY